MTSAREAQRRRGASILMLASGFAGLGYQIVWTQQSASWLGHESAAVLAVVTAFFGGLALGGLALGPRIEASARPLRWYVGCELTIALWSLLLLVAWSPFGAFIQRVTGAEPQAGWQWLVAFSGTFLLFLPATAAMGATLPAMERLTAPLRGEARSLTMLYASNTAGAVVGVLLSAFWLVPRLGLGRSALVCVGLNLLCGALAQATFGGTAVLPAPRAPALAGSPARGVLARLALTGLLGIGYEVLVVRVLSQVTEDTVYTLALLLAVYLVGSAAGAAAYGRWLESRTDREAWGDRLLAALAAACLLGTASLWGAQAIKQASFDLFGASFLAAIAAEAVLALVTFGAPTVVMGALFSHLSRSALAQGIGAGRALGINLLAAALAPVLYGVLAVPALGPKLVLLLIVVGYLLATTRAAWSTPLVWLPAAGALGLALFAPALRFVTVAEGGRVVSYEEGVMAAVSVVEDGEGVARLHINNRQQEGSSATRHVDARQAWLPLLLHPEPRRALFLGLGTGVTAAAAAEDPSLQVDAVELLPEVIAVSAHFTQSQADAGDVRRRPNVIAGDARRYVRASPHRYDVIVSDNFHPARSGSGALYTVEHFEAVKRRLSSGGVFCQWLPLHQLDLETLRSIVRSFVKVYPRGGALIASNSLDTPVLGLIARDEPRRFDAQAVRERVARLTDPQKLARLGLDDELAVLGGLVAGPAALARFAGDARLNTDDLPVVAYGAPRITYTPDSRPRDRLIALLEQLSLQPDELLSPAHDPTFAARLSAYWSARDRYIESGRDVRPSSRVEDMLAQVQEPLLSVLRLSPDFRPAYDPLLTMASALARSNVAGARALLGELARLQPARPEAPQLLALGFRTSERRSPVFGNEQ